MNCWLALRHVKVGNSITNLLKTTIPEGFENLQGLILPNVQIFLPSITLDFTGFGHCIFLCFNPESKSKKDKLSELVLNNIRKKHSACQRNGNRKSGDRNSIFL